MRRPVCWLRPHAWVAVTEDGVMFVPNVNPHPVIRYVVDKDGEHRACRRCGFVERGDG